MQLASGGAGIWTHISVSRAPALNYYVMSPSTHRLYLLKNDPSCTCYPGNKATFTRRITQLVSPEKPKGTLGSKDEEVSGDGMNAPFEGERVRLMNALKAKMVKVTGRNRVGSLPPGRCCCQATTREDRLSGSRLASLGAQPQGRKSPCAFDSEGFAPSSCPIKQWRSHPDLVFQRGLVQWPPPPSMGSVFQDPQWMPEPWRV